VRGDALGQSASRMVADSSGAAEEDFGAAGAVARVAEKQGVKPPQIACAWGPPGSWSRRPNHRGHPDRATPRVNRGIEIKLTPEELRRWRRAIARTGCSAALGLPQALAKSEPRFRN
jgi:hypothetical protein